jgi:nicotinate-nucleotide--dimethylbenzimidazole phosphoribosyltransferase
MKLNEAIRLIEKPCEASMKIAKNRWDSIAKPLNSLGKLEDIIIKSAGFLGNNGIDFSKKCVVVMCADNGIVEEGVTQVSNEITAIVAENMTCGKATINILSQKNDADVIVIDIGIAKDINNKRILNKKIMYGTNNFFKEPSMSRELAIKAIETGIDLVKELKGKGYNLIATGEMGIGNTTTSSAITACLLNKKAGEVTGRGAGLSDIALLRKIEVIDKSIALHNPNINDPIDILSKVGGLDIAGLTGVFLGGAIYKIPVLIDGFISSVAALLAVKLCPYVKNYIFATHISNEPAGKMLLDELGFSPLLDLRMCLGEGTGAVMAFPIFDLALEVYLKMSSFGEAKIETYKPQV